MSDKEALLSVVDAKSCYGRVEVLHGISLDVFEGEVVAIVGANGAGKTTLMRTISGVQDLSAGSMRFAGESLDRVPAHRRISRGIAQVPEGRHVFPSLSVEDNLQLGAWSLSRVQRRERARMDWAYQAFPILHEKRSIAAGRLSGGQQQMVAIARAMMVRPRLLLLDEPSMGLAPLIVKQVFEALHALKQQGMTILLIEQNATLALEFANRAYVMETGSVTLEGPAAAVRADPRVQASYLGS